MTFSQSIVASDAVNVAAPSFHRLNDNCELINILLDLLNCEVVSCFWSNVVLVGKGVDLKEATLFIFFFYVPRSLNRMFLVNSRC